MSLRTYLDMLSYMRPHGQSSDRLFRSRYLSNLPDAWTDEHGNIHVEIDVSSRVLFSAHTDTVHRTNGRQTIHHDTRHGIAELSRRSRNLDSNCLGADDTTGCYLLREMVLAGIPGYYIFHYGEESGGLGSRALAWCASDWLTERFNFAIAFDRRGYKDVITHQLGDRCASDKFAKSFANMLRLPLRPAHGVYTDTAEYADYIPECANISVGYHNEHSANEWQDTEYLSILRDRLLTRFDADELDCTRNPIEEKNARMERLNMRSSSRYDLHDMNSAGVYLDSAYAEVQAHLRGTPLYTECPCCGCTLVERDLFDETCNICGFDLRW